MVFDLDEGRNVEYEPEMTSQSGCSGRINQREEEEKTKQKSDFNVSVLWPRVCSDPSYYTRTAGTALTWTFIHIDISHIVHP